MNDQYAHDMKPNPIIVFSHLRWEFVKQRPQHILERFAKNAKILFVEEPIGTGTSVKEIRVSKNILVIQPNIDSLETSQLTPIVWKYIQMLHLDQPILWFYSAQFDDLRKSIPHSFVVYDCMDELSAFKGASADLIIKEKALLAHADVVFTGGHSLYKAKKQYNEAVYAFPSSVDRSHFAKALKKETKLPADLRKIPHPIVGFYGVLDERIDQQLLWQLAKSLPRVSFVLIGPVVKIDPSGLPKAPNLHYLGQRSYDELPNYLKGFDVAMMPFALNEATRFISPTKTLEFMAARKPIISTPIIDVVHDFGKEVMIAKNAQEFVKAIDYYCNEPLFKTLKREFLQKTIIQHTSWDLTVERMQSIIQRKQQSRQKGAAVKLKGSFGILSSSPALSYP